MNDIFGKLVSIFLAVSIFFGLPLVYMSERAKTAEQLYLLTETTHFVDSVCNTGKISSQMIHSFYGTLAKKSSVYEISVSHEQPEYVYDEASGVYERCLAYRDETDIWAAVEQAGDYFFNRGDFFVVTVTKQAGFYFPSIYKDSTVSIRYGGTVKYETY